MENTQNTQNENGLMLKQNGEETNLSKAIEFDAEEYQRIVKESSNLAKKRRSTSVVPKYYEFTMSVELVNKQYQDALNKAKNEAAKKKAAEMREANLELTWDRFKYVGLTKSETRKGLIPAVLLQNQNGLFINLGAQLVRIFESLNLAKGTEIEIEFVREETNKNGEGSTKIYEVYLLEDEDEEQKQ